METIRTKFVFIKIGIKYLLQFSSNEKENEK